MNRLDAAKVAGIITNSEILMMFDNAKENIKDWSVVSICNKGMTKGCAWNILASDFDLSYSYHPISKINMIREFGEYLPEHLKPIKKAKQQEVINIVHQEPNFKNYEINNKKS